MDLWIKLFSLPNSWFAKNMMQIYKPPSSHSFMSKPPQMLQAASAASHRKVCVLSLGSFVHSLARARARASWFLPQGC